MKTFKSKILVILISMIILSGLFIFSARVTKVQAGSNMESITITFTAGDEHVQVSNGEIVVEDFDDPCLTFQAGTDGSLQLSDFYGSISGPTITYSNGYTFDCYKVNGSKISSDTFIDSTEIVVYSKEVTYTISYDTDGGTVIEDVESKTIVLPETIPTKNGYAFYAWYTDEDFKTLATINTPLTQDITLYARYKEVIKFDLSIQRVVYDGNSHNVVLKDKSGNPITLDGFTYTFKKVVETGSPYVEVNECVLPCQYLVYLHRDGDEDYCEVDNVFIYLIITYSITYKPNTGETAEFVDICEDSYGYHYFGNSAYNGGKKLDIKTNFTKENYIFDSWNSQADGTGISYRSKTSYEVTENMVLYAIYRPEVIDPTSSNNYTTSVKTTNTVNYQWHKLVPEYCDFTDTSILDTGVYDETKGTITSSSNTIRFLTSSKITFKCDEELAGLTKENDYYTVKAVWKPIVNITHSSEFTIYDIKIVKDKDITLENETKQTLINSNENANYYCVVLAPQFNASSPSATLYTHSLSFVGGTGVTGTAPNNLYQLEGRKVILPNNTYVKAGCDFLGWSDGTKIYDAGVEYTVGSTNVEFTAVFGHLCNDIGFDQELDSTFTGGDLASGHYYLTSDITLTSNIITDLNGEILICLNGHILNLNGYQLYNENSVLEIYDCDENLENVHNYKVNEYGIWILTTETATKTLESLISMPKENDIISVVGGAIVNGKCASMSGAIYSPKFKAKGVNFIGNYSPDELGSSSGAIFTKNAYIINCNFYGNRSLEGSAIYGKNINIYNSTFMFNTTYQVEIEFILEGGKGTIYCDGNLLVKDSTFKYNSSVFGGAIFLADDDVIATIISSTITDNTASEEGGGVCFGEASCFVKGTLITMGDGSTKAIEEIRMGDTVKSFNHETGEYESQKVNYVYAGLDKAIYFTLNFESGASLSIVDCHDLFNKEANKYVTVSKYNYSDFIDKYFYNTTLNSGNGGWDKIESIDVSSEGEYYYSIYVEYTVNSLANGFLSCPDDVDYRLNIYKFNDNLVADSEQLAKDLETFGVKELNDCNLVKTQEEYDSLGIKYYNIYIGKGLLTANEGNNLFYELHNYNEYTYGVDALSLIIGENTTIKNNKVSDKENNVYLKSGSQIIVLPNAKNINVGVTLEETLGVFSKNVYANNIGFTSDNAIYGVKKTLNGSKYDYSICLIKEEPCKDNDYTVVLDDSIKDDYTYQWYKDLGTVDFSNLNTEEYGIEYAESINGNTIKSEFDEEYSSPNTYLVEFYFKKTVPFYLYFDCDEDSIIINNTCNGYLVSHVDNHYVAFSEYGEMRILTDVASFTLTNVKIQKLELLEDETNARIGKSTLENANYFCVVFDEYGFPVEESVKIKPNKVSFVSGTAITDSIDDMYQFDGRKVSIPVNLTVKTGYKFLGWNSTSTATTALTFNDNKYTVGSSNVTFYGIGFKVICKIDDVEFPSISAAVDSIKDNTATTITLVADAKDNVRIPKDRNITIDLNGYVLTSENNEVSVIYNQGNLTIKDSNTSSQTHYFAYNKNAAWTYLPNHVELGTEIGLDALSISTLNSGSIISVNSGVITRLGNNDQFAGIYNDDGGKLTIENANIIGNKTQHSAIYNVHAELIINKANILGNTSYSGAGIKNYNGTATIGTTNGNNSDVVIAYNTTTTNGNMGDGGGAIYNILAPRSAATTEETYATLTINHVTITNNKSAYKGGGISNAIDKLGIASVVINNAVISNNESAHNGGGIANYTHNANGQAIITINNATITNNQALTRTYNVTTASGGNGGAIANNGTLVISGKDVLISKNEAIIGGAIYNNGTLKLEKGTIDSNKAKVVNPLPYAAYEGLVGGIYNDTNGNFLMSGGSITKNQAESKVGGILNQGAFVMFGGSIIANTAKSVNGVGGVAQLGTMVVGGTAVIKSNLENTNVKSNLMTACPITLGSITIASVGTIPALSDGAEIYITFATKFNATDYSFTKSEGTFVTKNATNAYSKYFNSDVEDYEVVTTKNSGTSTYEYLLAKKYELSYETNGGNVITSEKTADIIFPTNNPTRNNYIFDGWYTDSTLKTKAVENDLILKDTTIYAGWIKVIKEEPTKDNDYKVVVDDSLTNDVTYQWYQYKEYKMSALTPTTITGNFTTGDYDADSLTGYYELNVCIKLDYFIEGGVFKYKGTGSFFDELGEDGYYSHNIYATNICEAEGYFFILIETMDDQLINITDFTISNSKALEGETNAKLSTATTLKDTEYLCKVFKDSKLIATSNTIAPKKVTFASGNATTGTTPSDVYQLEGRTIKLPANPYTKTGYNFEGWKVGTTTYAASAQYTVASSNNNLTASWTEKTAVSIDETKQSYVYNAEKQSFVLKGTHKDLANFKVEYYVNDSWTEVAPINAGTYDVKITRAEDATYQAYTLNLTDGLTISKFKITLNSDNTSFTYNGEDQTSNVQAWYMDAKNNKVALKLSKITDSKESSVSISFVDAKKYYATFAFETVQESNNYEIETGKETIELTMNPKEVEIIWCENNYTYNGKVQTVTASYKDVYKYNVQLNVTFKEDFKNAGTYTATATFAKAETDYKLPENVTKEYNIKKAKASINTDNVVKTYTYTGLEQVVNSGAVLNHDETTLVYTNNTFTNVGTGSYTITVSAAESDNYLSTSTTVDITVNKAQAIINTDNVVKTYTYTGMEQVVNSGAVLNHNETTLVYTNNTFTNVGTGSYTITVSANESANYLSTSTTFDITVNKAQASINTDNVVKTYTYTGMEQVVNSGAVLNHNESSLTYTNNKFTNVYSGKYKVTISSLETANYLATSTTVEITVNKAQTIINTDNVVKTYTYTGVEQVVNSGATLNHNESILVYSNNTFTNVNTGKYIVTISSIESANYKAASVDVEITVNKAESLINTLAVVRSYQYTGMEQVVNSGAVLNHNETTLVYTNNKFTNVGTGKYIVTISALETANYKQASKDVEIYVSKLDAMINTDNVVRTYTYTGMEQVVNTGATLNHNETELVYTNNKFTNVGSGKYIVTITAPETENYNSASTTVEITVAKAKSVINTNNVVKTYTYNGGLQVINTGAVLNHNETALIYTNNYFVNTGKYFVNIIAPETMNYLGASESVEINVSKMIVDEPSVIGTYAYTGKDITVLLSGVESYMTTKDSLVQKETGSYQINYTLDNNHEWSKTSDGKVTWTIEKGQAVITVNDSDIIKNYNEKVILPTALTNLGEVVCDKTSNDLVNVGKYVVTYTVLETENYYGTTKSINVTINKLKVNEPTVIGEYSYTGNDITVLLTGVESFMTTTDSLTKKDVGVYNITYTLDNNHEWNEGSDGIVSWEIKPVEIRESTGEVLLGNVKGLTANMYLTVEITAEINVPQAYKNQLLGIDYYNIPNDDIKLSSKEVVGVVFDVELYQVINGVSTKVDINDLNNDANFIVAMLLPEDIDTSKITRIIHYNNGKLESYKFNESKFVDGYYLMATNNLEEFAFIYEKASLPVWSIILIIVLGFFFILILLFILWKDEFDKVTKKEIKNQEEGKDEKLTRYLRFLDFIYRPINKVLFGGKIKE